MNEMRVWKIIGKILTREGQSTWRETCPIASLATTNPTWNGLGLNSGLDNYGPAADYLSYVKLAHGGHSGTRTSFCLSSFACQLLFH
jgi:hypothetical protein